MTNLALVFWNQGRLKGGYNSQVKKAIELLEYVVEVGKRTFAEEHQHRLASKNWLAYILRELGSENSQPMRIK
jgi:hypothetical protein